MNSTSSFGDDNALKHSFDSLKTATLDDMEGELETRKSLTNVLSKLCDISLEGDLPSLLNLLQEDPLILDRTTNKTKWSPLHMASLKGNIDIVRALLQIKPNMCFARDGDGKNSAHVAAMEGHIDVLKLFYEENSHATRERTNDRQTILHLCVKHNHFDALEKFLEFTHDVELLNSKDNNGNTILHLAVSGNQKEMVKLILKQQDIAKNAINNNGLTALDSHIKSLTRTKTKLSWFKSLYREDEILVCLTKFNALRAKDVVLKTKDKAWVENQSQSLMVVASLIATMAFQVVLSPPRGFWQDGKIPGPTDNTMNMDRVERFFSFHDAGAPIARDLIPALYHQLIIWNTIAMASSLGVIFLLISGLSYKRWFVEILRITMWISVTATFTTYSVSLTMINWDYKPTHTTTYGPPPPAPPSHKVNPPSPPMYGPPPSDFVKAKSTIPVWIIMVTILLVVVPFLLFLAKFLKKRHFLRSRSIEMASIPTTSPISN